MIYIISLFSFIAQVSADPVFFPKNGEKDTKGITHYIESIKTPAETLKIMEERFSNEDIIITQQSSPIVLERIINLGLKIWDIIERNQPVASAYNQYANALPHGVRSAMDLENFSELQTQTFRRYGKNGYGFTSYEVIYTLIHRYGGQYNHSGKYLTDVTILPNKVYALWPNKVSLSVQNVSVSNRGTREEPVASVLMEMNLRIKNILVDQNYKSIYEFKGDSAQVLAIK